MSYTSASLLLVFLMFGLAVFFLFAPPEGFDESLVYRITIPFLLLATAFGVLENLRTRAHMSQLVGALRSLIGRTGGATNPRARGEAIEILIESLRSESAGVRSTAATQLRQLTGQDHGEDAAAWDRWWAANKESFGRPDA